MILASSHWGGWLASLGVPGIYRSQASLAPGVKVRMGTRAQPHRRHRRRTVHLGHLAAAALRRPRQPVADRRLRAPCGRTAALARRSKPRDTAVLDHLGVRRRLRRITTDSRARSSATGRCAPGAAGPARARCQRLPGRPGACRWAAAGVSSRGCRGSWRAACTCAMRVEGVDLLTLDLHASVARRSRPSPPAEAPAEGCRRRDRERRAADARDRPSRRRCRRRRERGAGPSPPVP